MFNEGVIMRSNDEKQLRDKDALNYDKWYLDRGITAVEVEDEVILNKLEFTDNMNFLDFGCGTGRFTEECKKKYPTLEIYGLDISPKSIEILDSKNICKIAKEFDASIDKISDLDFPQFDRILSMQMIQHLEKDGAINSINNIYDSLSMGGVAVIELYNFTGFNRILERFKSRGRIKKIQKKELFFEYRYGANEFQDFLEKYTSFKNTEVYGCQNISRRWINKFPFLRKFDLWLSKFSFSKYLGYYFIIIARK